MMKLQKPVPKTLSKTGGKLETGIKKKKSLMQKSKKNETGPSAAAAAIAKGAKAVTAAKLIESPLVKAVKKDVKEKAAKNATKQQEKKEKAKAPKPLKQQGDEEKPTPLAKEPKKDNKVTTQKTKKSVEKPTAAKKAGKKEKKEVQVAIGPILNLQKKKETKQAFKKQKQAKNKAKKAGEEKPKNKYDPEPFDEAKFHAIVNEENVAKVAKALKKQVAAELKESKTKKIFSDYRYILNVAAFKIANCPKRMVKLNLKHSLVGKDDDVALIVADLQRGAKADYDPTIQHYEDLLREAEVEGVTVIPMNQLRKEYKTFESVRKLSNTYDYFMVDGRISSQVVGFCGKLFQKPRCTLHSVRMDNAKNLKSEISKAMRRTAYKQLSKGDLISIPVGNHEFTAQQLAENIVHVVSQLDSAYAGGLANVRNMHLKIDIVGTSSLPLYMSMGLPPPETPNVVGPREQRLMKMKREANEVLMKFNLTKEGKLVKLSAEEAARKLKVKRSRDALLAEKPEGAELDTDDEEEAPVDDDGEESVVPAKKARKEESSQVDGDVKKKSVEDAKSGGDKKDSADGKDDDAEDNEEDDDDDELGDDDEELDEEEDDDEVAEDFDEDDEGGDEEEDDEEDEAGDDDDDDEEDNGDSE